MLKKLKIAAIYVLLFVVILFLIGGAINVIMVIWADPYIVTHEDISSLPQEFEPDCILVLGASVIDDTTMSLILKDRVDVGLEVYSRYDGKVPLLMSGGSVPGKNEVNAMSVYAMAEGVDEQLILTDPQGVNTYASLERAKEIFDAKKILIVTQDFHMARSVFIARSLGMEAYGVTSDLRIYYRSNHIREYFARIKDLFNVLL